MVAEQEKEKRNNVRSKNVGGDKGGRSGGGGEGK